MSQASLFDEPTRTSSKSIDEKFHAFHAAHPEVYDELVELARCGVAAGQRRLGMKQLFEVLRWHRTLRGLPAEGETFKLNNNYTSRYARLVMTLEPDLAKAFETRTLLT